MIPYVAFCAFLSAMNAGNISDCATLSHSFGFSLLRFKNIGFADKLPTVQGGRLFIMLLELV